MRLFSSRYRGKDSSCSYSCEPLDFLKGTGIDSRTGLELAEFRGIAEFCCLSAEVDARQYILRVNVFCDLCHVLLLPHHLGT